jgi:hypothetical protein
MRKFVLFWLASLALVWALTAASTRAQTSQLQGRILSGPDIGFRVEGVDRSGAPVGTVVIRVNDQWIEVGGAPAKIHRIN